jgi:organic hydroperoxide reductase OsmC/OhrA
MAVDGKGAPVRRVQPEGTLIRTALVSWLTHPPQGHAQIVLGSRAGTPLYLSFPSEPPEPEVTDPGELMAAAHGAAFAASLASILDAVGTPARELVTSTAYEHGDPWYELKSIEISVFGRIDTPLDAEAFESAALLAAERCRRSFGLGAQTEVTVRSELACVGVAVPPRGADAASASACVD